MVQSRSEVMQQLASLSTAEILSLLTDETILEVAAKYFETHATNIDVNLPLSPTEVDAILTPPSPTQSDVTPAPRAKRPLNAFMAFRTFYMKIFPDIQQKSASGFLTTLWNKDPFRNKWALIAKVYSFVRDEVGKRNIALSRFLDVCCPAMNIIHPSRYIAALGWSVTYDDAGCHVLHQDRPTDLDHFQNEVVPSTEMDLLRALLQTGYLSDRGLALLERLGESTNGIMTTYGSSIEPPAMQTPEKISFIETIRADPVHAAKELFRAREDEYLNPRAVATYEVHDLSSAPYTAMQAPQPDPLQYYNFAGASMGLRPGRTFHLRSVEEFDSIDIDSPYDVDAMMGYTQSEGERTEGQEDTNPYDPQSEYHPLG
ncbi:MAT1-1-1 [Ilyonectria robusta]|uniref:MAT1-1-1 n=1 Tax=Ilyonectria robusta TaxID=1079257 RepID=UPI001E8E788C|nr:MAT1-1-1 [Ilyonectria robusta]KAH8651751.1 MAT1-1-1 [Ilyonectria robusta]